MKDFEPLMEWKQDPIIFFYFLFFVCPCEGLLMNYT
jgi:hypothetical protein